MANIGTSNVDIPKLLKFKFGQKNFKLKIAMDSLSFDKTDDATKKYKRCAFKLRKKWDILSKLHFPGVDFGLEPFDPKKEKLNNEDAKESMSSMDRMIFEVCEVKFIRKKVEDWEQLRVNERVIFERLVDLLVDLHHPLKKEENDQKMPYLMHKKKNLMYSLMSCIDMQYNYFKSILSGLQVCMDLENYESIPEDAAERFYKWNKYDQIIKTSKELENNQTLEEEIRSCEEQLKKYDFYDEMLGEHIKDKDNALNCKVYRRCNSQHSTRYSC